MSKTVIVPVLISFALSLLLSLIHIFSGEMKIHVPVQVIFRYVCAERCPRGEWSPESQSFQVRRNWKSTADPRARSFGSSKEHK